MIDFRLQGDTQVIAKLDALPGRLAAELTIRLTSLAQQMQATIKRRLSDQVLKVRTGNLRDSIDYDVARRPGSVTATVFSGKSVKYGAIHEFGGQTAPHVIEPRKDGVLAFQMGGKTVFARRINHPGSKIPARPFMRPTLSEYRDKILASLNEGVKESLQ